ncbi:hypothetical protein GCM10023171_11020 [Microbacterium panaciterrae]|uniref:DUF3099 domain-containing protein n=1 Tax=Microbacterium panaciterrae TaxID=985759 RepID=A0ABP8P4S3_9MICO
MTSLPRAPRDEAQGRVRQYVITMSIRMVCFLLMFFVQPIGWWTWVFGIAAAVLPYIAVVFANAGDDSVVTTVESPRIGIEAASGADQQTPPAHDVITLSETAPTVHGAESRP